MASIECRLMGIDGDGGRSFFLEAEEAKPEMMKMREIMVWPGVRVELRLKVEDVKTEEMRKDALLSALQMWEGGWKVRFGLVSVFCWDPEFEGM